VCAIACERSKRLTKYTRLTVSCAAPAYLLYAPRDLITILLYNLKTKHKFLLKEKLFQNTLWNMSLQRHKVILNHPL